VKTKEDKQYALRNYRQQIRHISRSRSDIFHFRNWLMICAFDSYITYTFSEFKLEWFSTHVGYNHLPLGNWPESPKHSHQFA
jgi:hypothetical protein